MAALAVAAVVAAQALAAPARAEGDPCAPGGAGWTEPFRLMAEAIPTAREAGELSDARLAEARAGLRAALAGHRARPDAAALCRAVAALRRDFAPAPGPSAPADGPADGPVPAIAAVRCDRDATAETILADMMTDMKPPEAGGPLDAAAFRDFSVTLVGLQARIVQMDAISLRSVCLAHLGTWLLFRV